MSDSVRVSGRHSAQRIGEVSVYRSTENHGSARERRDRPINAVSRARRCRAPRHAENQSVFSQSFGAAIQKIAIPRNSQPTPTPNTKPVRPHRTPTNAPMNPRGMATQPMPLSNNKSRPDPRALTTDAAKELMTLRAPVTKAAVSSGQAME